MARKQKQVMSRCKNPDKEIDRLRNEVGRLNDELAWQHRTHIGHYLTYYNSTWTASFSNRDVFKGFNPGDEIVVRGIVRKVEKCASGNSEVEFATKVIRQIKEKDSIYG